MPCFSTLSDVTYYISRVQTTHNMHSCMCMFICSHTCRANLYNILHACIFRKALARPKAMGSLKAQGYSLHPWPKAMGFSYGPLPNIGANIETAQWCFHQQDRPIVQHRNGNICEWYSINILDDTHAFTARPSPPHPTPDPPLFQLAGLLNLQLAEPPQLPTG